MALNQIDGEDDLEQGSPHAEEEVQPGTDHRHMGQIEVQLVQDKSIALACKEATVPG